SMEDALPWTAGATGLLIAVGVFVSYVGTLTRLNVRFWYLPAVFMLLVFAGTFYVFKEKVRTGGFWSMPPRETLGLICERPAGTDVKLLSETVRMFEREILPLPDGATMRSSAYNNRARIRIEFDDELMASVYPELFRNKFIVLAEELGGMFMIIHGFGDTYMKGGMGGATGNSTVRVTGYNSKELKTITDGVLARLGRQRRVRNAYMSSGGMGREGADETVIVLDRAAMAQHRLSMAEVVGHLRRLLGVENPWHMVVDGRNQRLMLSFDDAAEVEHDQLLDRTMTTSRGEKVRLGRLLRVEQQLEINSINRHDQRYSQMINWEYIGTESMKQKFTRDILAGIELPYGYTAEDLSGQQLEEEEEEELRQTLWLTLAFIFMALAAMFESFALPLLVLSAIPMALSGVATIFWGTGSEFDSSAKVGLILMFGIVVNNAILLINRFRLQIREIVEQEGYGTEQVPAKRRLGGFDLWRLDG
ncbi:MAG: efflux RND transporter permease subunit, partial [bacterium]|nr:efflux RND transporter permease subunit [bacterium]